jgi:hypothetical protein
MLAAAPRSSDDGWARDSLRAAIGENGQKVPAPFSTVRCLSWFSCRYNLIALHERDQGATTHRPTFAIGDALAVSLDHLIGAR